MSTRKKNIFSVCWCWCILSGIYGAAQRFYALRIFAGLPPGPQGPDRADLLVALGLHENGALAFGGPLFDIGGDDDETESDSGMSVEQEEDDDDVIDVDDDIDGDDAMNDDNDAALNDDDVQIMYESIHLDWSQNGFDALFHGCLCITVD